MPAPKEITVLIRRFKDLEHQLRHPTYNETQTRREFIDPLFRALGWDIDNTAGHAENYKDVVHEDSLKIDGGTKAPDYSFRIGGTRKFFLEAKKPAVALKDDVDAAYQVRRYAWSAKLPLSVLSNFCEFAIYDTRIRPRPGDKASTARTLYVTYEQLPERWDEIAGILSKEAILKGSFDKYATGKQKRGTSEVDDEFLKEIESWREALAKNIALRNRLTPAELNFAVQQTIDRIIFLRISEDRGIEAYGRLLTIAEKGRIYAELTKLFKDADDRYNSGLFHFEVEKGRRTPPDKLSLSLHVDDKVLKDILQSLYYPESPYEFSVLPTDILGQVYEQFLGKVIRLTSGGHAKVEEKPEVKKAGGVYYTPTYIVEYIVANTVGPYLRGKTPKSLKRLYIVDPACGSGSFLLGAYQFLLDWHLKAYIGEGATKNAKGARPKLFQGPKGDWRLTTGERKRILLSYIFGVDVDPQAVEVTKLSLLLKVLESESAESLGATLRMFKERALPDLDGNIRCGNSLVGPDYSDGRLALDDGEFTVNTFDWRSEFPDIFKTGGFDVVIGNPPYSYRNATEESLRPYYTQHYQSCEGNFDLYKFFIERSLTLLKRDGVLGFIASATFLIQPTFTKLRQLILANAAIDELSPLGPGVFEDATVDTTIFVARRGKPGGAHKITINVPRVPTALPESDSYSVRQSRFAKNEGFVFDYRLTEEGGELAAKLFDNFPTIETGYEFGVGINTGYIRDELVADRKLNAKYHPMVAGDGISRYGPVVQKGWIMYDGEYVRNKGDLGRTLPAEHLLSSPKILVVRTRNLALPVRIIATIDEDRHYNLNRLSNIVARDGHSLEGLLGILNSKLFNWLYSTRFYDYEIKPVYLRASPLAASNDAQLIRLVRAVLGFYRLLPKQKTTHSRIFTERRIQDLESKIDERVFALYGLTAAEKKLVNDQSLLFAISRTNVEDEKGGEEE